MGRLPKVEEPGKRTLEQALLVRLHSKGIRLWVEGDRLRFGRVKGSGGEVTPEDKALLENRLAVFLTMLRFDRPYGAELIRDAHGTVARRFPTGSGCDISETQGFMDRAHDALDAGSMHGLWCWLDRYVERALGLIEEHRGQLAFSEATGQEAAGGR